MIDSKVLKAKCLLTLFGAEISGCVFFFLTRTFCVWSCSKLARILGTGATLTGSSLLSIDCRLLGTGLGSVGFSFSSDLTEETRDLILGEGGSWAVKGFVLTHHDFRAGAFRWKFDSLFFAPNCRAISRTEPWRRKTPISSVFGFEFSSDCLSVRKLLRRVQKATRSVSEVFPVMILNKDYRQLRCFVYRFRSYFRLTRQSIIKIWQGVNLVYDRNWYRLTQYCK